MPNVNAVLNDQIRRLARREIRANTKTIKKATGHYRRDIAGPQTPGLPNCSRTWRRYKSGSPVVKGSSS